MLSFRAQYKIQRLQAMGVNPNIAVMIVAGELGEGYDHIKKQAAEDAKMDFQEHQEFSIACQNGEIQAYRAHLEDLTTSELEEELQFNKVQRMECDISHGYESASPGFISLPSDDIDWASVDLICGICGSTDRSFIEGMWVCSSCMMFFSPRQ